MQTLRSEILLLESHENFFLRCIVLMGFMGQTLESFNIITYIKKVITQNEAQRKKYRLRSLGHEFN